jgi:hypothetical protein
LVVTKPEVTEAMAAEVINAAINADDFGAGHCDQVTDQEVCVDERGLH